MLLYSPLLTLNALGIIIFSNVYNKITIIVSVYVFVYLVEKSGGTASKEFDSEAGTAGQ